MKYLLIIVAAVFSMPIITAVLADQNLDEQMIAEVRKANPEVNHISYRNSKQIDNRYSVVAIYTSAIYTTTRPHYRLGTVPVEVSPLSGQKIGIFVIDDVANKITITLDVLQSERSNDFFPRIQNVTRSEALVSFTSDYAIEAMKEYKFDLISAKLLGSARLVPPPRPTMCNHGGRIEPCND